jgi:hypothetical protein
MASRQRAEELIEDSRALRAEAEMTLKHSRALALRLTSRGALRRL